MATSSVILPARLILVTFLLLSAASKAFETFTFPSEDGLEITADFYAAGPGLDRPIIVLFHQAGFSRGEYREIAPRLTALGFHALAIDQRSGNAVNGVPNQTASRAREAGLSTNFMDAVPDMRAAFREAATRTAGPVLSWGSSYSSALALKLAAETPLVSGVLAFSPGEYFSDRHAHPASRRYVAGANVHHLRALRSPSPRANHCRLA